MSGGTLILSLSNFLSLCFHSYLNFTVIHKVLFNYFMVEILVNWSYSTLCQNTALLIARDSLFTTGLYL